MINKKVFIESYIECKKKKRVFTQGTKQRSKTETILL